MSWRLSTLLCNHIRSLSTVWSRLGPSKMYDAVHPSTSTVYRNHRFVRRFVDAFAAARDFMRCVCLCMGSRLCGWPNLTPQTKILSLHPIYYCDQHIHDELLWFYLEFCGCLVSVASIRFSYGRPLYRNGRSSCGDSGGERLPCRRKNVIGTCHRETFLASQVRTKVPDFVAHRSVELPDLVHYERRSQYNSEWRRP